MRISWDESLATGVEEIDDQHKELFARFDRLFSACSDGRGKEEVLQLLGFLREYVVEHFTAEEKLQFRSHYPLYPEHKQLHMAFIKDVEKLERSFRDEGATLSLVIMTNKTLTTWLLQHIGKMDMEFAAYLKQQQG